MGQHNHEMQIPGSQFAASAQQQCLSSRPSQTTSGAMMLKNKSKGGLDIGSLSSRSSSIRKKDHRPQGGVNSDNNSKKGDEVLRNNFVSSTD